MNGRRRWKIVHRLGGHALAMEVVAVFLRENPEVSYRTFAQSLERDGIAIMEKEVAEDAEGRLAWHAETHIARLLEPTLRSLSPARATSGRICRVPACG